MAKLTEVAEHLDLSTTRIHQLVKAGILPKSGRAAYDLDKCRIAYIRYIREIAAGRGSKDGTVDLVAERARLTRAQALKAERENAIHEGEYFEVKSFHRLATVSMLIMRSKLLAIPPKLAPLVAPEMTPGEAQATLTKVIYEVLNELAATDLAKYDHSNEFATRSIADLLYGDEETEERDAS